MKRKEDKKKTRIGVIRLVYYRNNASLGDLRRSQLNCKCHKIFNIIYCSIYFLISQTSRKKYYKYISDIDIKVT